MKLSLQGIKDRDSWESKGYELPGYDVEKMACATRENPYWIHFGGGNLFRAFHANVAQRMLNEGETDRGLILVERRAQTMENIYKAHDNLGILVTLKGDGTVDKTVIASVAEVLCLDFSREGMEERLREIFQKDSLQLATFTITEKGYRLKDGTGEFLPDVAKDLEKGPWNPGSYLGKLAFLLYVRYLSGKKPVAMVSTDNCFHNGDRLYEAMGAFAKAWEEKGLIEPGFAEYLASPQVSFTWSMIDKITPGPDPSIEALLKADGVEETGSATWGAAASFFANGEETEYLVVEDAFPNGRPGLEKGGVLFTDRETVDRVEKMKVCTCLNPLHTCLAIFGCLLGYERISQEMRDPRLRRLVEAVGYEEGLPAATDPGILNPQEFMDQVIQVRLPNPFLPDTPQRIATDTSQKLAVRFGETIRFYQEREDLQAGKLKWIPLVLAGWLRYLLGIDDRGKSFPLSPDPLLEELLPRMKGIRLGDQEVEAQIRPILEREDIFGVNLYQAGLADKVTKDFRELLAGEGAVSRVLQQRLSVTV